VQAIALAIAPIEAAYHLKRGHPSALSLAGLGARLLVPFSLQRASNLFGDTALAFYAKAGNVQISIDVIGNNPLSTALWKGSDNEGTHRHIDLSLPVKWTS
jgi:hypothetical protein